jgi:hypothetical protein
MQQYPVFARPGDNIYIKSLSAGPIYYKFHGQREHELKFFIYLERRGYGIGYPDAYGIKKTPDYPSKSKDFLQLHNQRLSLLTRAKDSLNLSPEFCAYAEDVI